MRPRRLIVIASLATIILVAIPLIFIHKGDGYRGVCDSLLKDIQKNDAASSYSLLSDTAKRTDSLSSWTGKVKLLYNVYYKSTVTPVKSVDLTTTVNKKKGPTRIEYVYTVTNQFATSDALCYATKPSGYKVDSFSSAVRQEGTQ